MTDAPKFTIKIQFKATIEAFYGKKHNSCRLMAHLELDFMTQINILGNNIFQK